MRSSPRTPARSDQTPSAADGQRPGETCVEPDPAAELATMIRLVEELEPAVVNVGHGRDSIPTVEARTFAKAWADLGGEVGDTGRWRADRTVAFSGLAHPALSRRAGRPATEGLRGATSDGRTWCISAGWLRTDRAPASANSSGHEGEQP